MKRRTIVASGQKIEPWDWDDSDYGDIVDVSLISSGSLIFYPSHGVSYLFSSGRQSATGPTERLTPHCRECGDPLPTGANFCIVCGAEVSS